EAGHVDLARRRARARDRALERGAVARHHADRAILEVAERPRLGDGEDRDDDHDASIRRRAAAGQRSRRAARRPRTARASSPSSWYAKPSRTNGRTLPSRAKSRAVASATPRARARWRHASTRTPSSTRAHTVRPP